MQERELELQKEQRRQEENDKLRQEFAQHANAFHQWLQETRYTTWSPLMTPHTHTSTAVLVTWSTLLGQRDHLSSWGRYQTC